MTTTCNGCWHLGEACGHCAVCSGPPPFPVCGLRLLRWAHLLSAYVALIGVLLFAMPVHAATSSADLETIAKTLEQNPAPSSTLNSQLLSLLREPALTLDGVTLPTTAAGYTKYLDTALKLRPKGWLAGAEEHFPAASGSVSCTAQLSFWDPTPPAGLRFDAFAWGKGNCPSVLSAAIARAWAWKLRQAGR